MTSSKFFGQLRGALNAVLLSTFVLSIQAFGFHRAIIGSQECNQREWLQKPYSTFQVMLTGFYIGFVVHLVLLIAGQKKLVDGLVTFTVPDAMASNSQPVLET